MLVICQPAITRHPETRLLGQQADRHAVPAVAAAASDTHFMGCTYDSRLFILHHAPHRHRERPAAAPAFVILLQRVQQPERSMLHLVSMHTSYEECISISSYMSGADTAATTTDDGRCAPRVGGSCAEQAQPTFVLSRAATIHAAAAAVKTAASSPRPRLGCTAAQWRLSLHERDPPRATSSGQRPAPANSISYTHTIMTLTTFVRLPPGVQGKSPDVTLHGSPTFTCKVQSD